MELKQLYLEQLDREAAKCRSVLERVPENDGAWKPHPKSMELGYLAALVASMPGWIAYMIDEDELDFAAGGKTLRANAVETRDELLAMLDQGVSEARRALTGTTEDHLMKNWRLRSGFIVLAEAPRYVNIIDNVFTHLAHHRGQLTVYLRLKDAKVPGIYGPSADERFGG